MKRSTSSGWARLAIAACIGLASVPASAGVYEFRYEFASGGFANVVTGQVSGAFSDSGTPGDTSDDHVVLPTVLNAQFNGSSMISSSLLLSYYDNAMPVGFPATPTSMYFAASANNFILSQCGSYDCFVNAYADPSVSIDYFMMRTISQGGAGAQYYSEVGPVALTDPSWTDGHWSLREIPAVPEPGNFGLMLAGLAALAGTVRHRRAI